MSIQSIKLICCLLFFPFIIYGNDSLQSKSPLIRTSYFCDLFYVYDFGLPKQAKRQDYLYNHNRHNQINVNLLYIKAELNKKKFRSSIAIQAGTYVDDNYSSEPQVVKNFHEAYVGIALNNKKTIWLDAGIFASHIGFESATSINNWTLTRSLLAENSPYYLSGIKIAHKVSKKLEASYIICNGWQRIKRVEGNSIPSIGTQLFYSANEKYNFNWSTFIGTDDPDSSRRIRVYNNFYYINKVKNNFAITAGFDIGIQQKNKNSKLWQLWYSPVIIAKYNISPKYVCALRAEYYHDPVGVIIQQSSYNFKVLSGSICFDYLPNESFIFRIEPRLLNSKDPVFFKEKNAVANNFFIAGSIAVLIKN